MAKRLLVGLYTLALPALAQTVFPGGSPLSVPGMSSAAPFLAPAWGAPAANPLLPIYPLGAGVPMLGGWVQPGLQLAPNWLSHQHLLYMTNPYLGGPAAGNPYLQPSLPLPFAPPAFSPGLPTAGQGPSAPRWPAAMPLPVATPFHGQPVNPYLPSAAGPALPLPPDPAGWLGQMARPPGR